MPLLEPVLLRTEVFLNPLIGIHMRLGRYFGLFGENGQSKLQSRLRLFIYIGVIFWISKFTALMIYFSSTFKSFNEGTYTWANTVLYFSVLSWVLNIFWQRKRIGVLTEFMTKDLEEINQHVDAHEKRILETVAKQYRNTTYGVWLAVLLSGLKLLAETIIRTIISPDYMFDFSGNSTVFNPVRFFSPYHIVSHTFFVAQFLPLFSLVFQCQLIAFVYTFAPSLMDYISFKLDIIAHQIEAMNINKVMDNVTIMKPLSVEMENFLRNKLCKVSVMTTVNLRWFTKELESFMRISIFMDFLTFSILLGFAFHTMATAEDVFPAFSLVLLSVLAMWPYHSRASKILDKCDKVRLAIYSSNWSSYPTALQKVMFTMMFEFRHPLKLSAYFVELNIETFVKILNAGVSYFNVVRNMS